MGLLTNISLFAGVGGLDLGAKLVGGFKTVAYVEFDRYAQGVLMSRMRSGDLDDAPIFEDVRTFDGRSLKGRIDVVSGGFPCQDVSHAGKRAGLKDGTRSGLWSEFARIIREVEPGGVLVENVGGLLSIDDGRGFGIVLGDLAALGYDAEWCVRSAADVGAPHRRERVWVVAWRRDVYCPPQWPTPSAGKITQSGDLVNADGTPWDGQQKPHSAKTGKPVQTALTDAVNARQRGPILGCHWPSPNVADGRTDGLKSTQQKPGSMHSVTLAQAAQMWPTPTVGDLKNTANNTATRLNPDSKHHPGTTLVDAVSGWPTPTASGGRPCEGNVRILRAKVLNGEMTEAEAEAMLNGKSVFEAQGKMPAIESDGGLWPTPTSRDGKDKDAANRGGGKVYAKPFATPQARDYRSGQGKRWRNKKRSRNLNDQIANEEEN